MLTPTGDNRSLRCRLTSWAWGLGWVVLCAVPLQASAQWNDYRRYDLEDWRNNFWADRFDRMDFDAGLENEIAEELAAERAEAALEELDAPSMYVDSTDGEVPSDDWGSPAHPIHPHAPLFIDESPGLGPFHPNYGFNAYDPDPDYDAYDADPDVEAFDVDGTNPDAYDPRYYTPDAYDPDSYVEAPKSPSRESYSRTRDADPSYSNRRGPTSYRGDARYSAPARDRHEQGLAERGDPYSDRSRTAERYDLDDQIHQPPAAEMGPEEEIRTWPEPSGTGWYHQNWHDEWYDMWHDRMFVNWFDD